MKRSAPLRRSPFPRQRKEAPRVEREPHPVALSSVKPLRVGIYAGSLGDAVPKVEPVRSEAYRRAVASLACIHCGRMGCQCAHANTGKGMGTKSCDLECFPLCPACHSAFDQGALFTKEQRRAIEPQWARATRAAVRGAGLWPKKLEGRA